MVKSLSDRQLPLMLLLRKQSKTSRSRLVTPARTTMALVEMLQTVVNRSTVYL